MRTEATLEAPTSLTRLRPYVIDLGEYPRWMPLVHRATVAGPGAWDVELRAKVGPFARSKRLRMVRSESQSPSLVRFERREIDGRTHAPWVLTATITSSGGTSTLTMHLHYGGSLFTGGILERVLGEQIERGRSRLAALVEN